MNMLVNILRGSRNREILDLGYDRLKTYGMGKEYGFDDWLYLITQMLHNGLIEIAYDDNNRLRVTTTGNTVLFENKKVNLAIPPVEAPKTAAKVPELKPVSKTQQLRDELFERLRVLRRELSQRTGTPPYNIFSDATLTEMAEKRPVMEQDMLMISGVGERKLQQYGDVFISAIRSFMLEKEEAGVKVQGSTHLVTWELFRQGNPVETIAQMRNISPITVTSHLCAMYERGEHVDFHHWLSDEEMDVIRGALPLFNEPYVLKDLYEHFHQQYSYEKIRWAIAAHRRVKSNN